MAIAISDPLHALSLARTALSDPCALPSTTDLRSPISEIGEGADSTQVAHALESIDHAIRGLYFDPLEDPALEACVTLDSLERLVSLIAEGLGECENNDAVERIRDAVQRMREARALLAANTP